jgi:hypothetical protein
MIDLQPAGAAPATRTSAQVFWSRLGGKLGVGFCAVGLLLVFLGWNGAASYDRIQSQFPYLISGGIGGLALVVIGVGLIIVQNQRADRAALQETVRRLQDAVEQLSGVAGAPAASALNGDGAGHAPARQRPTPEWVAEQLPTS